MAKKVENGDRKKMVRSKPTTIDQEQNTVVENAHAADDDEDRPFMVRVLTVGVSSYLAQKVWIKRKMLTDGWYTKEMTETQQIMVTAFEYMSAMGLIFVIGIVVGIVINKMAKWVKKEQQKGLKRGKIRVCPDNKYERLDKYN
ncbi:hypothetical protein KXD40_004095 [Peronospora effusa]|uniref:Uncharacterized protein n=1 Tax=Peronospora effusa TaxID=542832 RepID=A0A3M6VF44_9STRA|nr:hypothetical protein DD238_005865 [Peronospora effusa]RQM13390.1 hypothetical protein DD237_006035 [Peronospora effusa]UIZ28161.1 hypothetical protein KXD40_004095 [Peronospora effusa]CAI5702189.1 unnamed protein product [Peronospora effusa]